MELPLDVVKAKFAEELEHAKRRAERFGFQLDGDVDTLKLRADFVAANGDKYIVRGTFDDYRLKPPLLEFEDPETGEVGTGRGFPARGKDGSFFHSAGMICAPFNRKAYVTVHGDWVMADWASNKSDNVDWSQYNTIATMMVLIHSKLSNPDYYGGGRWQS